MRMQLALQRLQFTGGESLLQLESFHFLLVRALKIFVCLRGNVIPMYVHAWDAKR